MRNTLRDVFCVTGQTEIDQHQAITVEGNVGVVEIAEWSLAVIADVVIGGVVAVTTADHRIR